MLKKSLITITCVLGLSSLAQAQGCPTGGNGPGEVARNHKNADAVMAPGTIWKFPQGKQSIQFIAPGIFKLRYDNKQAGTTAPRHVNIGRKTAATVGGVKLKGFKGSLDVGDPANPAVSVATNFIWFEMVNGRCALRTFTNEKEYHSSTAKYKWTDERHHILKDGVTKVRRYYDWVKQ